MKRIPLIAAAALLCSAPRLHAQVEEGHDHDEEGGCDRDVGCEDG